MNPKPPPAIEQGFPESGPSLATGEGRRLWRSLEEWGDSAAFRDFVEREFPHWPDLLDTPVERRRMLQLMAASLLLGGFGGCGRQPKEEIIPHVNAREPIVPGRPRYFATALCHGGYAQGVLVESHLGRPTKVEGNDRHPASLGATDIYAQAAVLGLYDPDRSQTPSNGGMISTLQAFAADLATRTETWVERGGAGVCLLTETITSPTLAAQMQEFFRTYPEARWVRHDPVDRDNALAGARLAFGRDADTLYRFDRAAVILALDCDFLTETPARTRYAHDFIAGRRLPLRPVAEGSAPFAMNRLYALESTPTPSGAMADHRRPLAAGSMEAAARALAGRLDLPGIPTGGEPPVPANWLEALARDLSAHPGTCLIIAGDHLPPSVHALVQAMNERLGAFGRTVFHIEPVAFAPAEAGTLVDLTEDLRGGRIETLVILGGNPVYTAPADLDFAAALARVPLRIHHGLHADETAALCHWHLPALHELESWSDASAYDGTVSLVQPLIAPLYGGRSVHELMALLLGQSDRSDHDLVRDTWRARHPGPDFERFWRGALRDGVVPGTAHPPLKLTVRGDLPAKLPPSPGNPEEGFEIRFCPDPCLYDGRHANNGWLQELPRPMSKLTWENAALLSPGTARRLCLGSGDRVGLEYRGRRIDAPVWIQPGQADDTVTVHFGYGRSHGGTLGTGTGFDAYRLRTSAAPWFDRGLALGPAEAGVNWLARLFGDGGELPTTQHHHALNGRDLVRVLTPAEIPARAPTPEPQTSLYPPYPYEGHAWAMAIDLNACIGCNACVLACQAENNIPIVGRDQVLRGREMHWLRVDRYYAGAPENPKTYFQPVPCMQCEKAPCEPVCPVQASIHDSEGLNNQVYNRCIGTRFCQSNCPYKVRRFNFFEYSAGSETLESAPIAAARRNPEVTVRSRGVMEKCTYCIQRINRVRIAAEEEDRPIADGEIRTACQQACPTRAIVFGDLNAPGSRVSALKAQSRHYVLLEELGTRPRTTYLARLRNPNPELGDD